MPEYSTKDLIPGPSEYLLAKMLNKCNLFVLPQGKMFVTGTHMSKQIKYYILIRQLLHELSDQSIHYLQMTILCVTRAE